MVPFASILIIYDPYVSFLFHTTQSPELASGIVSYYSQWIPKFSDRMRPITGCKSFPLTQQATGAFESLKKTIEDTVVTAVDESILFEVETDASEVALAATLNQNGRPVAFFSRTLQGSELKHVHRERTTGHDRDCKALETLLDWKALHSKN